MIVSNFQIYKKKLSTGISITLPKCRRKHWFFLVLLLPKPCDITAEHAHLLSNNHWQLNTCDTVIDTWWPVTVSLIIIITRKRAIAKTLHLEGHSDFAPDVLGLSGLFGLKILFSDVLRSAPGNRHVEPIHPLCAMRMRVVNGCSTHSRVNK